MQPEVVAFMFAILLIVIKAGLDEIEYWRNRDAEGDDEE